MSGYRDDLGTARQRILQLEDELARLPPKPRPNGTIAAAILAVVIALVTVLACVGLIVVRRTFRQESEIVTATPVPVPAAPARTLQLYWPAAKEPLHVDVNTDGTADLIVLLWEGARPEAALNVAALDGKSFSPIWTAGSWPASWSSYPVTLTHAGRFIVVTDSQGGIHSLELATGVAAGDYETSTPPNQFSICAAADGRGLITLKTDYSAKPRSFDLEARTEMKEAYAGSCAIRRGDLPGCGVPAVYPCIASNMVHASPRIELGHTVEDRELIVTLGLDKRAAPREQTERPPPYFVTQSRANGEVLAEGVASLADDKVHVGSDRLAYADGKVIALYEAPDGSIRLVARDAKRGTVLFSRTVSRTQVGDAVRGVDLVDHRVFVRLDSAIHVFDANTSEEEQRINFLYLSP